MILPTIAFIMIYQYISCKISAAYKKYAEIRSHIPDDRSVRSNHFGHDKCIKHFSYSHTDGQLYCMASYYSDIFRSIWKIQKRPDTGAYWSDAEKIISPISG